MSRVFFLNSFIMKRGTNSVELTRGLQSALTAWTASIEDLHTYKLRGLLVKSLEYYEEYFYFFKMICKLHFCSIEENKTPKWFDIIIRYSILILDYATHNNLIGVLSIDVIGKRVSSVYTYVSILSEGFYANDEQLTFVS